MYKYRQVQCPKCKHIFMWLEGPTGSSYCIYRRKNRDEEIFSTTCPKCNLKMVVPSDTVEGIDINDEAIILSSTLRGI